MLYSSKIGGVLRIPIKQRRDARWRSLADVLQHLLQISIATVHQWRLDARPYLHGKIAK
jgi:hypothetical protein